MKVSEHGNFNQIVTLTHCRAMSTLNQIHRNSKTTEEVEFDRVALMYDSLTDAQTYL